MTTPFASRGATGFVGAVCAGLISAALFAFAAGHIGNVESFVLYLTALPLFAVGLGAGSLAGLVASTSGVTGLILSEPSGYAILFVFGFGLPVLGLIVMAMRYRTSGDGKVLWYPEGNILVGAVFYPCILFLALSGMTMGHTGGLLGLTQEYSALGIQSLKTNMPNTLLAQMAPAFDSIIKCLPSFMGTAWVLIVLLNMYAAQQGLQLFTLNLRPRFAVEDIRVPEWLIVPVAIAGLIGAFAPEPYAYTGANLAFMLAIPYLFAGIAIVHCWVATKKYQALIYAVFYLVLLPFVLMLVALLGMLDQWINFRQRINKTPGNVK